MRRGLIVVAVVLLWGGWAVAGEPERGWVDLYAGATRLFESDVPDWKFADWTSTVGGRVGVWLGRDIALTFRTWYFQTDAKEERTSPSDLAFLGLALEVLARWRLTETFALYGSLGPVMAVTTLDLDDQDDRSIAPGASAAVGAEVRVLGPLRLFTEAQTSLVFPSFHLRGRTITPRLLNVYGLMGIRVAF